MKFLPFVFLICLSLLTPSCRKTENTIKSTVEMRAPAYPLITIDPYISAWSVSDTLYETPVQHWTGKDHPLIGAIRVDGEVYRFLGKEVIPMQALVPTAVYDNWEGKFTTGKPGEGWQKIKFNDNGWLTGNGAFGTQGMPAVNTLWETKEIWVRRTFSLPENIEEGDIYVAYGYDDNFLLYLNGKEIVDTYCCNTDALLKIEPEMLNFGGENVLAAYCINTGGAAYVELGLFLKTKASEIFTNSAKQEKLELSATQTQYTFTCGPVELNLEFVSPLIPDNLDLLSRPVNYINYAVKSKDNAKHNVELYFEATPQWAVNYISQEAEVTKGETRQLEYLKAGTTEQPVLKKKGDDIRIDWGYFYFGVPKNKRIKVSAGNYRNVKESFKISGTVPSESVDFRNKLTGTMPAMAISDSIGTVGSSVQSGYIIIAYDDIESIQYFGTNLPAWWKDNGKVTIQDALNSAVEEYPQVMHQCSEFDQKVMKDALDAGGPVYADLCILAYRQSVAAHKLTKDGSGNILFLSKENNSNGSIGTVDVTYPSAPLYLKYNPELLKGMLNPIFYYSESGKWEKPFAAHDVGTYPLANGQTYGGNMPVEECGNMVILSSAIAQAEGNADYAKQHWDVLTTWTEYLVKNGLDPVNQLCTDDFAGHFAHNVNLSAKAIMGVACYSRMASMLDKTEIAEKYRKEAQSMAREWMRMADDGDHYRLTFDQPGTWSQKYNLVWDKLLDLNVFPDSIAEKEVQYYLTKQNRYGLPLDNRRTYTKSDWIVWTATLAGDQEDFEQIIKPLHLFLAETPDRVPMTDWYETTDATHVGFKARSVVGGYFIKMLETEFNN